MTGPDSAPPPPPPESQTHQPDAPSQPAEDWTTRTRRSTQPLVDGLRAAMGRAETLVLAGALVILAVDLVFGILIRSYMVSGVVWAGAAALIAIAVVQRRAPQALPLPYRTLLMAVAGLSVVVAARQALADLLHILRPPMGADAAFVVGFIGLVVGGAVMAAGVWLLLSRRE